MTDTTNFLPNQIGITSDVLFNFKNSAVPCRSYRCSIPTNNASTFSPQSTAIFSIPARRNCFLDTQQTYLRTTIKNNDGVSSITLDSNGACVINSLNIYSGSNLLESVQQYNVLYSYLMDFQMDIANRLGASCTLGGSGTLSTASGDVRKGQSIALGKSLTTCMPVLSGVIGTLGEKMLPLNISDDLRVELQLEALNSSIVATLAVSPWIVSNMELVVTIVELSDAGMGMVQSVTPFSRPVYLHSSSYRHYVATQLTTAGQGSYLVPARFASLKNLIVCPRGATQAGALNSYSLSSRANPNWTQYYWRLGSLLCPQKPVNLTSGFAESFAELQRSFHGLSNNLFSGSIQSTVYNVAETADATVGDGSYVIQLQADANSYKNGFAIAQELESFSNRNDTILSGINCLGSSIFFEPTSTIATGQNYILDFYAYHDMILVLENGLYSVKF